VISALGIDSGRITGHSEIDDPLVDWGEKRKILIKKGPARRKVKIRTLENPRCVTRLRRKGRQPPRVPRVYAVQPAMELGAGVLDVFVGALFGGFGFSFGVSVRLEEANRYDEIHGLTVLGRFAGSARGATRSEPFSGRQFLSCSSQVNGQIVWGPGAG
jgi:hypothetical protein